MWLQNDPPGNPRRVPIHQLRNDCLNVVSPQIEIIITQGTDEVGTETFRAKLIEHKTHDGDERRWVSTLTLIRRADTLNDSLCFEIESPLETLKSGFKRPVNASSPRFMRRILEMDGLSFFDGVMTRMTVEPTLLTLKDVPNVLEMLNDPLRRGILAIYGTESEVVSVSSLKKYSRPFDRIVGLGTGVVLDGRATSMLNEALGQFHQVPVNGIRTYVPGLDFLSHQDSRRHPVISPEKIQQLGHDFIAKTLESTARRQSLDIQISAQLHESLAQINEVETEILVRGKRNVIDLAVSPELVIDSHGSTDLPFNLSESKLALQIDQYLKLQDSLKQIIDFDDLTEPVIEEILDKLARFDLINQILNETKIALQESRTQLLQLQQEVVIEQLDHLDTFAEKELFFNQLNYLRGRLKEIEGNDFDVERLRKFILDLAYADISWIDKDRSLQAQSPKDFTEILLSFDDLSHLEFTGEESDILELDRTEIGIYSSRAWDGLRTLNDYVRAKIQKADVGGLFDYLDNAPPGYFNQWPKQKIALQESESTMKDPSLVELRRFPVPKEVNSSQFEIMMPHLKIGQRLRIHFFDDVANTGKIYIGYIGMHLGTSNF
jgi:hypothetical protein